MSNDFFNVRRKDEKGLKNLIYKSGVKESNGDVIFRLAMSPVAP
jgi:hypothetical protein